MKVLSNGELLRALFDVHLKHKALVYPEMFEFEALMLHGVVGDVTVTLSGSSVKAAPQVSPYEHAKLHPAIRISVKKFK